MNAFFSAQKTFQPFYVLAKDHAYIEQHFRSETIHLFPKGKKKTWKQTKERQEGFQLPPLKIGCGRCFLY